MAPGQGWAELGADWRAAAGWQIYGEAGRRWSRWDLAGRAWWQPQQEAAGVAVVARW